MESKCSWQHRRHSNLGALQEGDTLGIRRALQGRSISTAKPILSDEDLQQAAWPAEISGHDRAFHHGRYIPAESPQHEVSADAVAKSCH